MITVAYVGFVEHCEHAPKAADDAADVCWMPVRDLPCLTADHNLVIETAVRWLRTNGSPDVIEHMT